MTGVCFRGGFGRFGRRIFALFRGLFRLRVSRVMMLDMMRKIFFVGELPFTFWTSKVVPILVKFLVPNSNLNGIKHYVAIRTSIVHTLLRVQMRHPMLHKQLLVLKWPSANITICLKRIFLIMVDALMFHSASVACKSQATFPSAHVRFQTRVRIHMPF